MDHTYYQRKMVRELKEAEPTANTEVFITQSIISAQRYHII